MSDTVANKEIVAKLLELTSAAIREFAEGLAALLGKSVQADEGELKSFDGADARSAWTSEATVLRFELDGEHAGAIVRLVMPTSLARTIAGILAGVAESELPARAAHTLDGPDQAQLGKVGSVFGESLHGALERTLGIDVGVRFANVGVVPVGTDPHHLLGDDQLVGHSANLTLDGHEPAPLVFSIGELIASAWNGKSVQDAFGDPVPTRGTMACYLGDNEPWALIRAACRRVGLDLDTRPAAEVPNPAAYRGRLVLIDVPVRADKRFQWCRRLRDYESTCRVVLLIRQPSRQRVVDGYLAKADVILGWPVRERDLAAKLEGLIANMPGYEIPQPEDAS